MIICRFLRKFHSIHHQNYCAMAVEIINLHEENIDHYGIGCIKNKKHPGVQAKIQWAKKLFQHGLTIKLLVEKNTIIGFIEYIPGLYSWRPISAAGYFVIHCIWVYKKEYLNKGYGSMLIQEVIKDTHNSRRHGIVSLASEGSWLASPKIFEKNGFYKIDSRGRYDLMAYLYKEAPLAKFKPWKDSKILKNELTLSYSHQCPANAKALNDIEQFTNTENIDITFHEFQDAKEAQKAPTGYGVFNLTRNNKILAEHYISLSRFKNIAKKEKLIET